MFTRYQLDHISPCHTFLVTLGAIMVIGKGFDKGSKYTLEIPLLHLCFGLLLCFYCTKIDEFHHPSFLFRMTIW